MQLLEHKVCVHDGSTVEVSKFQNSGVVGAVLVEGLLVPSPEVPGTVGEVLAVVPLPISFILLVAGPDPPSVLHSLSCFTEEIESGEEDVGGLLQRNDSTWIQIYC